MASRFLVALGTWDASNTAIWSATTGGATGASAPTIADDVFIDALTPSGTITIAAGAAWNNITITTNATTQEIVLSLGANFAPAGVLSVTSSGATPVIIQSNLFGTQRTITLTSPPVLNRCDFQYINAAGAGLPWSGTLIGDALGNSNITFTPSAPQYWKTTTTGSKLYAVAANFFLGTNGTGGAGRIPLPQDDVVFDANSIGATGTVITMNGRRVGRSLTTAGVLNSPTIQPFFSQVTLFGSLTIGGTMIPGVAGLNWIITANSGTVTITQGPLIVTSSTLVGAANFVLGGALSTAGAVYMTVTFDDAGFSVTAQNINVSVPSAGVTRRGIWTVTGSGGGSLIHASTVPLTDTGTIKFTDATSAIKTIQGGGKSYNIVQLSGAGSGAFQFTGNNSIANLVIDTLPKNVQFTAATNTTVGNVQVPVDPVNTLTIGSITAAQHTLTKTGGGTINLRNTNVNVSYSVASPANTFYTGAHGTNGGNNTNWVFNNAPAAASLTLTDASDALTSSGTIAIAAAYVSSEADAVLASGSAAIAGSLAVTEIGDTVATSGYIRAPALAIEEAIIERAWNAPGLKSIIGRGLTMRLYPQMLPQNSVYPAVTYSCVSSQRETAMGVDPGIVSARYQFSAWASSYQEARDLAEQLRVTYQRWRDKLGAVDILDTFIEDVDDLPPELVNDVVVHHRFSDFRIIYRE